MAKGHEDQDFWAKAWEKVRIGNEVREATTNKTLKKDEKENVKGFFSKIKDAGKK